ncbi:MAG: SagB/ThcOx family dehydrogenase [Planctomycetes bacterium]|nr:SagB/ThcOx family dehydrogenase [Planctomycetota bacterium]
MSSISIALSYHQQTKHQLDRFARSLGYLDWASQPDPFRTFEGAMRIELPLAADGVATPYADLYIPSAVPARPLDLGSIAILFELALGLSAWKEFKGNRWALRCNPSSGNLHPTEGYAILPDLPPFEAGVYHYVSHDHCLERRCFLEEGAATKLTEALPKDSFLVGLSSIHWREAWKYGERAFRYCQHDAGHAIATVRYAAAALGWSALLLDPFSDDDVAAMLGLDRAADFAGVDLHDREHPVALILVSREPVSALPQALPVEAIRAAHWAGQANQLSPSHVDWEIIDDVAEATRKPSTTWLERVEHTPLPPLSSACRTSASTLIRQRRSCLALDGQTSIPAETFYRMLDHLLPRPGVPPWDALSWSPQLHAGIFVHRVAGLVPGLYLLERDPAIHDRLRAAMRSTFLWQQPADCPEHLRLYCLMRGDLGRTAQRVSCDQEIASDGAFSLGMIADFAQTIRGKGAWWYRRLFWEAGVLGQVLYLEAEAAGVRSTGIGCYFDDAFHELLGLTGEDFQDLYHFTVGAPVEDRRLMTLPPYAHLLRAMTNSLPAVPEPSPPD